MQLHLSGFLDSFAVANYCCWDMRYQHVQRNLHPTDSVSLCSELLLRVCMDDKGIDCSAIFVNRGGI
jgi:hypothetical protein